MRWLVTFGVIDFVFTSTLFGVAKEPGLVPFYERLGWRRFSGKLLVTQGQATVPFTFMPMAIALRSGNPLDGTIDLLGPPW